jgi:hypothetical protein
MSSTSSDASFIFIEADSSNVGKNQPPQAISDVRSHNPVNPSPLFMVYSPTSQHIRRRMILIIRDQYIHMRMIGQSEELVDP